MGHKVWYLPSRPKSTAQRASADEPSQDQRRGHFFLELLDARTPLGNAFSAQLAKECRDRAEEALARAETFDARQECAEFLRATRRNRRGSRLGKGKLGACRVRRLGARDQCLSAVQNRERAGLGVLIHRPIRRFTDGAT
jgi:hypothetical protein